MFAPRPHPLLPTLIPVALGVSVGWAIATVLGRGETALLLAAFAAVVGLAALPVLLLFWRTQQVESLAWFLAVFGLALTFVDINPGFRKDWPFAVLANGFRVSLSDLLLLFLALLWWFDRTRKPAVAAIPRPLAVTFVVMLLWDAANAAFIAREPFFAWSLYWREVKALFFLWVLARFLQPHHFRLLGLALAAAVILQAIAVADQRFLGPVIFTAKLLKTDFALKSAAGSGYVMRFGGTMGHPNTLANFLAVALLFLWFFVPTLKGEWLARLFVLVAIALGLATLTITGSRGGWIGFAVALAIGILLWLKRKGRSVLIGALVMLFSVTTLFGSLFAVSETFRTRWTAEDRGSALVRVPLMETATNMIEENPVWGVGLGQYTREMHRYDRTNLQVATWYNQPVHNFVLLTAAEIGIPGLILHLTAFLLLLRYSWQTLTHGTGRFAHIGIAAFGGGVAWAIQEQFNPDYIFMPYYLWVVWGAMFAARRIEREQSAGLLP